MHPFLGDCDQRVVLRRNIDAVRGRENQGSCGAEEDMSLRIRHTRARLTSEDVPKRRPALPAGEGGALDFHERSEGDDSESQSG